MTLTGKRPPNRDPEWQRTELVQDTKALMVQDTKALMVQDTKVLMVQDTKALMVQDTKALMVQDTKMVSASQLSAGQSGVYKCNTQYQ